jgi:acetolactate synthase-1/2/3 large subunit
LSGRRTGGRAVVEALESAGIDFAFAVPGESFLGLLDALHDSSIRLVATRHEGGAAFMAEAFGQLTGRPAACLATRAVGAANLAIGLHTAKQDSTPLVALVGQVPRAFRGREAFQEADLAGTFGALCKAAAELDDPAELGRRTSELLQTAVSGRPGPVLLALPEDVLDATVDREVAPGAEGAGDEATEQSDTGEPDPASVDAVLRDLRAARRPVVVAGAGVLREGAVERLVDFAEATRIPVLAAWRRPDVFPNDHPLYLGMTGLSAPPTVRERFAAADVVLALGTRLSEISTFGYELPAAGARLIQVDREPGFPGDRRQPDLAIRGSVAAFLGAALERLGAEPFPPPAEREALDSTDRERYLGATEPPVRPPSSPIDPAAVVRALGDLLATDAIVTTDAGNFAGWFARYLRFRPPGRYLGPTSGAMGYALPAAIAAALAEPARPVVALAGDGGFAMLLAELETAVRLGLRLVALVLDNRMYGTIRMHQEAEHPGRAVATDLGPIDFAAAAEAFGARGLRVERDADVPEALERALAGPGVTVVHLLIDRRYLSVDRMLDEAERPRI